MPVKSMDSGLFVALSLGETVGNQHPVGPTISMWKSRDPVGVWFRAGHSPGSKVRSMKLINQGAVHTDAQRYGGLASAPPPASLGSSSNVRPSGNRLSPASSQGHARVMAAATGPSYA